MEGKMLRDMYDTMLDSGDLQDLMPEATGIWETDWKKFKQMQDDMDKLITIDSELAELNEDYWDGEEEW